MLSWRGRREPPVTQTVHCRSDAQPSPAGPPVSGGRPDHCYPPLSLCLNSASCCGLSHACPQRQTLEASGHLANTLRKGRSQALPVRPRPGCRQAVQTPFVPRPQTSLLTHRTSFWREAVLQGPPLWLSQTRPMLSRVQTRGPLRPPANPKGPVWMAPQLYLWRDSLSLP